MAITLREGRQGSRTARTDKLKLNLNPKASVREVCLLRVSRPLDQGDRLSWSGREYRVETAEGSGYVHLAAARPEPEPEPESG